MASEKHHSKINTSFETFNLLFPKQITAVQFNDS